MHGYKTVTNQKKHNAVVRITEDFDNKIQRFANEFSNGNFSEAARFLMELGLLIVGRLDKNDVMQMFNKEY